MQIYRFTKLARRRIGLSVFALPERDRSIDGMDSPRFFASNCGALVNMVVGISSSNERSPD